MEPSYLWMDGVKALDSHVCWAAGIEVEVESQLGLELRELAQRLGVHPQNISYEDFARRRMQIDSRPSPAVPSPRAATMRRKSA